MGGCRKDTTTTTLPDGANVQGMGKVWLGDSSFQTRFRKRKTDDDERLKGNCSTTSVWNERGAKALYNLVRQLQLISCERGDDYHHGGLFDSYNTRSAKRPGE